MNRTIAPPEPPQIAALPHQGRYPVPHVADWYGEEIFFVEEDPEWFGNLVMYTIPEGRYKGGANFGAQNPVRQRLCARDRICQVCAKDLSTEDFLYMFGSDVNALGGIGVAFTEPPTCLSCGQFAIQVCPALVAGVHSRDIRAFLVKDYTLYGEFTSGFGEQQIVSFEEADHYPYVIRRLALGCLTLVRLIPTEVEAVLTQEEFLAL